jgi:hypothetical protein
MRTYKVLLHGMGAGAAIWCLNIDSMVETGRIVRTAVHYGALHAPRNAIHSDTTGGVRAPNPMFERDEARGDGTKSTPWGLPVWGAIGCSVTVRFLPSTCSGLGAHQDRPFGRTSASTTRCACVLSPSNAGARSAAVPAHAAVLTHGGGGRLWKRAGGRATGRMSRSRAQQRFAVSVEGGVWRDCVTAVPAANSATGNAGRAAHGLGGPFLRRIHRAPQLARTGARSTRSTRAAASTLPPSLPPILTWI